MIRRIRWTENAFAQLEAIAEYVALTSPLYAARLIDRLLARITMAAEFPHAGRAVPEVERNDTRELIERPYRIIYRVDGDTVVVLAIVHSRRDFDRLRDSVREVPAASYLGEAIPTAAGE